MYLQNCIKLFVVCSMIVASIQAEVQNSSVIQKYEELQEIRDMYTKLAKVYYDERIKEINALLGTNSNRWDFIKDMGILLTWWSEDMNRRQDYIISKIPSVLSDSNEGEAFQQLKDELKVHLDAAENFWHDMTDKKLKYLRENPQIFNGLIREPIFTTEHPVLVLAPEYQPIYEEQMRNLTNIATIVKNIITTYSKQLTPELPKKNNITYFSYVSKSEMIKSNMISNRNTLVDSMRIFATERVSGDWRMEGKHGPTKEEFAKEYNNLAEYATNVVKDLDKNFKIEFFGALVN